MATVTPVSPQLPYSRRVSFNNLRPDNLDVDGPPDVTKLHTYSFAPKSSFTKSNDPELSKLLSNYSLSSPATSSSRKRIKLPEPPSRSILKNKLSQDQLRSNVAHANQTNAIFNNELNDLVNHPPDFVPKSELVKIVQGLEDSAVDDGAAESDDELPSQTNVSSGRRKSYAGMTDEELMALDPQFSKPIVTDLKEFRFDSLGPSYTTQRRSSASGPSTSSTLRGKQVLYPSSNENNYKSVSLTVKHEQFDRDEMFPRTILTVISGRKHTWNTIDWLLLTDESFRDKPGFLQHGDHLVVAALIPLKFFQSEAKSVTKKSDCIENKIQQKCEDILGYILENLRAVDIRLKITVELVMDVPYPEPKTISMTPSKKVQTGTKFMMTHLFKQYQPTLIVIGNKSTSLNFKYPRRMSKGTNMGITPRSSISTSASVMGKPSEVEAESYLIKLSSYLIRYSTVPVILAGNATMFHRKLAPKVLPSVTFTDGTTSSKSILDTPHIAHRQNSYCSDNSIESFCGDARNAGDSDSASLSRSSQTSSSQQPMLPDTFASMISQISEKSLKASKWYLEQIKGDKPPPHLASNKVHQAYISMAQGRQGVLWKSNSSGTASRAYKVKSLISYDEEEEKKNERMINDKKLKKSLSRNSAGSSFSGVSDEKDVKKKKKKSFLQKIGLKKS